MALPHQLSLPPEARIYYETRPVEFVLDQILAGRTNLDGSAVEIDLPQREILENVASGLWPVVPAGRGVGKTTVQAWIILWWIYVHPTAKVVVNSVKKEQLADNLWPEIRRWIYGAPLERDYQWEKTKVALKGREELNFAVARTGAAEEALQGYHDDYLLIVIEEASAIEDDTFDTLMGSLTGTLGHNTIAMFGNPRRRTGPFAKNIEKPTGRFRVTHISCVDLNGNVHPRVPKEFVERMASRYGEDSNQYRVHVLGLLPEADDNAIIPWEWVQESVMKDKNNAPKPDATYRIVWGLDVATFGHDSSVLIKRQGNVVLEPPIRRKQLNTMQNADWIQDEYTKTPKHQRPHRIYVDSIGVGAGVADRLSDLGLPVEGIAVSRVPGNRARFRRLRDELWWRLRLWFEKRNVYIPEDRFLIDELTAPHYATENGKIEVESKDKMRERVPRIGSPDSADALMLTFTDQDDLSPWDAEESDGWEKVYKQTSSGNTTWVSA